MPWTVLIPLFCIAWTSSSSPDVWAYSPCTDASSWIEGNGPPLHSWIRGLVPTFDPSRKAGGLGAYFVLGPEGSHARLIVQKPGDLTSLVWKAYGPDRLDGWLYGKVNLSNSKAAEFSGNDVAYVYSDFATALLGQFEKGVMLNATSAKITAYR